MKRMWPLLFALTGAALLIYGLPLVRDARGIGSWPSVDGVIKSSEPEVVGREKDRRTYAPSVSYHYVVQGKEYEGHRVTLVPRNYPQLYAVQNALAPFPVGATVKVFHHPSDPANSVLVPKRTGTEWAYPIAGALFFGLGVTWFIRT